MTAATKSQQPRRPQRQPRAVLKQLQLLLFAVVSSGTCCSCFPTTTTTTTTTATTTTTPTLAFPLNPSASTTRQLQQRPSSRTTTPRTPARTTAATATTTTSRTMATPSTADSTGGAGNDDTKKNRKRRIVVVGSANQDLTSYTGTVPAMGETVMGQRFATSCGGKGGNQAVAAARFARHLHPVSMICRVADDVFGRNLLQHFDDSLVETDRTKVVLDSEAYNEGQGISSGVAAITVDTVSGDNRIIVTPGANYELTPGDVDAELRALRDDLAIVVVQLEIQPDAALQALKTAKSMGAVTILNPAPAPESFSLDEFYPYIDILIPNESELRKICGYRERESDAEEEGANVDEEIQMARDLLQNKGVGRAVIVTLGKRGAVILESGADEPAFVDAPSDLPARDEPVVDTIGAGDSFCGSLAQYLASDLSLEESARRACGFASTSVRRRGASYPAYEELPPSLQVPGVGAGSGSDHDASMKRKTTLTFVTGNKNKLKEVQQILSSDGGGDGGAFPYEVTNRNLPDVPEVQGTPEEIAIAKCRYAAEQIKGPCFTEDTSLCFNALNGMPGPFIKFFLENCGHDGLNGMLKGFDDKTAYAQTILAFTEGPGRPIELFEGRTDGTIVPPRGSLEFGWDPIFEPLESEQGGSDSNGLKTYAEMDKSFKNTISHRGRSFAKFKTFLLEKAASNSNKSSSLKEKAAAASS